jgi:prolyl oligopeptidase
LFSCVTEEIKNKIIPVNYPQTAETNHIDTYFGEEIADTFRWLENNLSDRTAEWVKALNELTIDHFEQISFRKNLRQKSEDMWSYEKFSAPFKQGNRIF